MTISTRSRCAPSSLRGRGARFVRSVPATFASSASTAATPVAISSNTKAICSSLGLSLRKRSERVPYSVRWSIFTIAVNSAIRASAAWLTAARLPFAAVSAANLGGNAAVLGLDRRASGRVPGSGIGTPGPVRIRAMASRSYDDSQQTRHQAPSSPPSSNSGGWSRQRYSRGMPPHIVRPQPTSDVHDGAPGSPRAT
jgi:hypothetical protein